MHVSKESQRYGWPATLPSATIGGACKSPGPNSASWVRPKWLKRIQGEEKKHQYYRTKYSKWFIDNCMRWITVRTLDIVTCITPLPPTSTTDLNI